MAIQDNLVEFGNALAGRGVDLNGALGELPETVEVLEPVMKNLSDPGHQAACGSSTPCSRPLRRSLRSPRSRRRCSSLWTRPSARSPTSRVPFIQETITETPPTLDVGTRAFPVIRPFLVNSAGLFSDLQPGVDAIAATSPAIADALEVGAPVLRRSVKFNEQLPPTAAALAR